MRKQVLRMPRYETRSVPASAVRIAVDEGVPRIEARAIAYGSWSVDLGGFRERMMPGSVELDDDLLALFDHESSMVLGRTSSGTMEVRTSGAGVDFTAYPPDTQWARDLRVSMARGDIKGCSYRMFVEDDRWYVEDGQVCRDVKKAQVSELTVTSMPAYPQTTAVARSRAAALRATAFADTLDQDDQDRLASWQRLYQLESAMETTIVDALSAGDLAAASAAFDDFAAEGKAWFTAHAGPEPGTTAADFGMDDASMGWLAYSTSARSRHFLAELRAGRVLSDANEQLLKDAVEMIETATENIESVIAQVDPTYVDDDDEDTTTGADAEDGSSSAGRSRPGGSPDRHLAYAPGFSFIATKGK